MPQWWRPIPIIYEGDRYTTEGHRKTLKVNGWTFCPVDILDEDGSAVLPVKGGKWFDDRYHLIDIDNGDQEITLQEEVKDVVPFEG